MNYYQFHIADFALHTAHLTLEEEGVYRRLLDFYYDTESPIPKETKRVIRRLRLGSYEETVGIILDEFFELQEDGWHNLRADKEISEYHSKAEQARKNGKRGGRPKGSKSASKESPDSPDKTGQNESNNPEKTNPVNSANPEKTGSKANQEPLTNNHKPELNIPSEKSEGAPAGVDEKNNSSSKPPVPKPKFTPEHQAIADWMAKPIAMEFPSQKIKPAEWADAVRKLIELDNYSSNRVRQLWTWIRNHNTGSFSWALNCRTPMKLRERKDGLPYFEIIENQMLQGFSHAASSGNNQSSSPDRNEAVSGERRSDWARGRRAN